MIGKIFSVFAVVTIAGCATTNTYTLGAQKFNSAEEFQTAVDRENQERISSVISLKEPLSGKSLVVAFPSEKAIAIENERRFVSQNGRTRPDNVVEIHKNLSIHLTKTVMTTCEVIRKRNIYRSVDCRAVDEIVNDFSPSDNYDALFYSEPAHGSGQWFYASKKHGKQVFGFDMSAADMATRTRNYLSAIQAFAVRD